MRPAHWACLALLSVLWPILSFGHEIRPGYFEIKEITDGRYDILWKQPTQGVVAVHLVPHISGGALDRQPSVVDAAMGFEITQWRDLAIPDLDGRTLEIEGLDRTITDVLFTTVTADGETNQTILRPDSPRTELHLHRTGVAVPAYIWLGIEHILTGFDHLSFVLGLMLLVNRVGPVVRTVTAFTVSHSITLALSALHIMKIRAATIEALVAFSIIFVAVEVVHAYRGRRGLTVRYPWLIAFSFGLLHGSAFANALSEIGLPPNAIPMSLFLFNVGVEIGQLMFVAVIVGITWLLTRLPVQWPKWIRWIPPYAIGSFASFWFIGRLAVAMSL